MLWINFLHCYQPVNTDAHIIKEATEKSYARIIRAIEENKNTKFTLNINGCLFLRWEELGYDWLIKRIEKLLKSGRLELTGSVCYHPLLPMISETEIRKQITENEEILCKHFGKNFKAKGFFMPEMAYSQNAAKIIKDFGYEWLILDEIAVSGKINGHDFNKVYLDKASDLKIVFRNRKISSSFVPDTLKKLMKEKIDYPIITATDGELYGLRHIDHTAEFEKVIRADNLTTETISNFIDSKKETTAINIVDCSWESTEEDLKNNKPYILWFDPDKDIQQKLWELANLSYDTVESHLADENYYWARWHLVRGLASCTFWWASEKDFRHIFGPYAWNPDEIERGTNEFIRAVRALEDVQTRELKMKAEELYIEIKRQVWDKHWNYHWKRAKA
jgi:predicted glycosyl hydrolase (DUF1957 family)